MSGILSIFLTIFLTMSAAVAQAYGQTAASPSAAKPAAVKPAASSNQDRRIEAAIRTKLAKSKIGADRFAVSVQGGVATWEGTTSVPQHKGAATRMAKTAGAVAVVNNIRVSGGNKSGSTSTDASEPRRAQLKQPAPQSH